MHDRDNRAPRKVQDIATISLVAIVTSALATEALASHPPAPADAELSARAAAISKRVHASEGALPRSLPRQRSLAWNNR
jgi:hypothetical protein